MADIRTSPERQILRQYMKENNLLSKASRAIGQQMKMRRATIAKAEGGGNG